MSQYPRSQSEIAALVEHMMAGFTEHPEYFPHADKISLQQAYDEFMQASTTLNGAEAAVKLAASNKLEKQRQLEAAMKNNIRHATADCSANPTRLSYIGWGTRHEPRPIDPPASPGGLKVVAQSEGTVFLKWEKPSRKSGGGPVRLYMIERHIQGESLYNWELVTNSYNNEVTLTNQPQGVKIDYKVRASNSAGASCATNTVTVVL